uniref:Transmembrane protein n=1 Tax=viral metagenome TaxID=1070528 RepID=A0A6C0CE58_9ZZZZ
MQQPQSPQQSQSQNNMITPIDKIPLKTTGGSPDDSTDDPMIRDVLNEFEQELAINESQSSRYKINEQKPVYQPQQPQPSQQPSQPQQLQQPVVKAQKNKSYIDNELVVKSFIICIVIAIIINPYIFSTILSKVPENISVMLNSYDYFIKLSLIFVAIYVLFFYNLL